MNKPASVAISEFKQGMDTLISNSGLPPIVLESIVGMYSVALSKMAADQTAKDLQEWQNSIESKNKGE